MRWSHHPDEDALVDLQMTGRDPHDDFLDDTAQEQIRADLLAAMAPAGVCAEQPSLRERRQHFDETKVRSLLKPRTGNVTVQPSTRCTCGKGGLGIGPSHLYRCPRYATNPTREAA
jgi:hypothetical protein